MRTIRTPWLALVALAAAGCRANAPDASATETKPEAAASVPATPIAPAASKPRAEAPVFATTGTRAERLAAMTSAYGQAMDAYYAPFRAAKSDEERQKLAETTTRPDPAPYAVVARALVDEDATDATAFAALSWLLSQRPEKADAERWVALLERHHADGEAIGDALNLLQYFGGPAGKALIAKLAESSPHRAVRGRALMTLADARQDELSTAAAIESMDAEESKVYVEYLGQAEFDRLRALDRAASEREVLALYAKVVADYADLPGRGASTIGEAAKSAMFELQNLVVGKHAPEITGEDIDGAALALSDYRGKVVLLDFWGNW